MKEGSEVVRKKPIKDQPHRSYASHVKERPPLRKEVQEALSNSYGEKSKDRNSKPDEKVYHIKEKDAYYQGQWREGLPHGRGVVIFGNGTYFEGQFQNGHATDDLGLLVLPNGSLYQGQIRYSKVNGKGTMKYVGSDDGPYQYIGQWQNGKPHGFGEERYFDKSTFKGYFKHGVKEGHGVYYHNALNETYDGEFKDGLMHGQGSYTSKNGIKYVGTFIRGKKEGNGILETPHGKLSGHFANDVINGQGSYAWKDGRVYEGQFKESKFHGQGRISYKNGHAVSGKWEEGHNLILESVSKN